MVKLFVGNLAESVDSYRLKNLFLQYVNVQECDVLKNFAFVHVATDDDATIVIDKLDKTLFEGREIHIERSTSRLRKEPGMSDKCFSCGSMDHKTPQCPQEQGRRKVAKRNGEEGETVAAKRPAAASSTFSTPPPGGSCWGYQLPTVIDNDAELPPPANPELRALYEQYKESRSRYHYFREKLQKELSLQAVTTPPIGAVGRVDLTRTVQAPITVSYATPIRAAVPKASYPGAQQTPIISTQSHRTSIYPGATPTPTMSAPTAYPGAQASVYTTQQSAYGQQAPSQHYATIKREPVTTYASPPTYQRPQHYSTQTNKNVQGWR